MNFVVVYISFVNIINSTNTAICKHISPIVINEFYNIFMIYAVIRIINKKIHIKYIVSLVYDSRYLLNKDLEVGMK